MSGNKNNYVPGICNIGPKERRKRLMGGLIGFAVTLVGYIGILYFGLPDFYILFLFFPLVGAFVGLYQYTMKFCVYFAALAKYNFS